MQTYHHQIWRMMRVFLLGLISTLAFIGSGLAQHETRVSKFGQYRGYSQPLYNDWARISEYIVARDGTRLAADIFRPAINGKPVTERLPVIWTHNRYHRSFLQNGKLITILDSDYVPWLRTVLKHGYVVAAVDVRGAGASFGTQQGPFPEKEAQDAYDITEWFAAQPWCNGSIGMYGISYLGITQYMAASQSPPHLKAIFPEMAMFDLYSLAYPGGVFRKDFVMTWNQITKALPMKMPVSPVDDDSTRALLKAASEEHKSNRDVFEMFQPLPNRNSVDLVTKQMLHLTRSPSTYLSEIKKSKVAVYHSAGWMDLYSRDALVWFNNLNNPQKILIGPWSHVQSDPQLQEAEHLRWYDYWLKGIDNGVMKEAPIHYYTMGAPKGQEWRSARQWPLPDEKPARYYFHGGPAKSVQSVNDGVLSTQLPAEKSGQDVYAVDYSTTSGKPSRWSNGYGLGGNGFRYPDMTPNDKKGLTYTTAPLTVHIEVTGHPLIHLWISSTARDADLFAYLEEVDGDGVSHYVTEGTLRASHRAISKPPFNYLGLPFHRSFAEDVVELPDKPVGIVFDLQPTSNIFDKGHRIRVTITCADKDNTLSPELSPPPRINIFRDAERASYIILPVISTSSR